MGGIRRNVPIPTLRLPNDLKEVLTGFSVRDNAAALEAITKSEEETLRIKHLPELTELLKKHFEPESAVGLTETYQLVPKYVCSGILDSIKNRLLDFVLEMKENNVNPDEPNSMGTDPELVRGAVVNHIYGNNNTVAIGDQISQQINLVQNGDINSLFEQLREYEVPNEDLEELKNAIFAEPDAEPGKLGPKVSRWIGGMMTKAASGAWEAASQNGPALVMKAVETYYGG